MNNRSFEKLCHTLKAVADPDLQIRVCGGRGGDWSQENFFSPFGPQFGLKIRGGRGQAAWAPLLDLPLQRIYPDT